MAVELGQIFAEQPRTVCTLTASKDGTWIIATVGAVQNQKYTPSAKFIFNVADIIALSDKQINKITKAAVPPTTNK